MISAHTVSTPTRVSTDNDTDSTTEPIPHLNADMNSVNHGNPETEEDAGTRKPSHCCGTIEHLPNEILLQILTLLDTPRLSEVVNDEPSCNLTHQATADLKSVSLVSQRWRNNSLPLLFQNSRLIHQRTERTIIPRNLIKELVFFRNFITKHSLSKVVYTFTFIVLDQAGSSPHFRAMLYYSSSFDEFWQLLLSFINPVELLIIAHPEFLSGLASCSFTVEDSWFFDGPYHYLRLRQSLVLESAQDNNTRAASNTETTGTESQSGDFIRTVFDLPVGEFFAKLSSHSLEMRQRYTSNAKHPGRISTLFQIRPWSSLLLNEGSFIKAYSTYEFWDRRVASVNAPLVVVGNTN